MSLCFLRWYRRQKVAIVCVYPRLRLSGDPICDEGFYRQQVLVYVPWRAEDDALGEHPTWQAAYTSHGIVPRGGQPVPQAEEDDELEELADNDEGVPDEEWMVIARQHPNRDVECVYLGDREMDLAHDWSADAATYGDIGQLVNAVTVSRQQHQFAADAFEAPDVQLTAEQSVVIRILDHQIAAAQGRGGGGQRPPLRVIVQGKAGCGKSTTVAVMKSRIVAAFGPDSFLLVASTGAAAVNIDGKTIHNALLILPNINDFAPLTGDRARMFQESMRPVRFLIVDEYSMIGLPLLGMMERRCAEGKPGSSEPFGGLHVYLIGDLAQLAPVMQKAIFSIVASSEWELRGRYAYQQFQHAVVLRVSQRQADPTFREALDELGLGQCSEASYCRFRERFSFRLPPAEQRFFHDAIHVFGTNDAAHNYNVDRLERLGRPVARVPAKHNNDTAANGTEKEAGGLRKTLCFSVGSRVMLRANLWTQAGLVNGATGTVTGIVYPEGSRPPNKPPAVIMVKFDRYTGPVLAADGSVPICTIIRYWKVGRTGCTREQFPLTLAWASTVHAAQGLSCDRIVADVGNAEFSAGLAYVALSRCREWEGLLIEHPFPRRRLDRLQNMPSLQRKVAAIARIEHLARMTARLVDALDQGGVPTPPTPPPPGDRRRPAPQPPAGGRPKRVRRDAPPPSRGAPRGRGARGRGARGRPPRRPPQLQVDAGVQVHDGAVTAARITGDGHCLFSALLHQLHGSLQEGRAHSAQVAALRRRVVQYVRTQLAGPDAESWIEMLRDNVNAQANAYPPDQDDADDAVRIFNYLEALLLNEWGASETLRAVAEMERVNVTMHIEAGFRALVFSPPDGNATRDLAVVWRLAPAGEEEDAPLWNHYDSVVAFQRR